MNSAARKMTRAIEDAVTAARATDAPALREAADRLSALDTELVGTVLGEVTRMLVEEQYPDGLDADDIREMLDSCSRAARPWLSEVDPDLLLIVLAGALGIHPHDVGMRPEPETIATHAALLVGELLDGMGVAVEPYLAAAIAEIERRQTMDTL